MEEWKLCGVLFHNLSTIYKCLHCSFWLDQADLAKFAVEADLPDEFRANVIKNIYMPPLKHKIHLKILAFLINMGTSYLYKVFEAIIVTSQTLFYTLSFYRNYQVSYVPMIGRSTFNKRFCWF